MVDKVTFVETQVVEIEENVFQVLTIAEQGPRGAQGPPGPEGPAGNTVTQVAGENLSALRIVYVDLAENEVKYADKDQVSHSKTVLGLTTISALQGEDVEVLTFGKHEDNFWSWDINSDPSLFLGSNGAITQGPTSGAYQIRIGFVVDETTVFISINSPILT